MLLLITGASVGAIDSRRRRSSAIAALGPKALDLAVQVKGLAIPAHDPRAYNGLACSYATSNRGAHHTSGQTHLYEHRLKVPEIGHEPPGRFVVEGKGALAALTQNIMNVLDSIKSCKFAQNGGWTIGPIAQAASFVTGAPHSAEKLIGKGERSDAVRKAIQDYRAVYFLAVGGAGALGQREQHVRVHLVARLEVDDRHAAQHGRAAAGRRIQPAGLVAGLRQESGIGRGVAPLVVKLENVEPVFLVLVGDVNVTGDGLDRVGGTGQVA